MFFEIRISAPAQHQTKPARVVIEFSPSGASAIAAGTIATRALGNDVVVDIRIDALL
jgi:hypothetical protein